MSDNLDWDRVRMPLPKGTPKDVKERLLFVATVDVQVIAAIGDTRTLQGFKRRQRIEWFMGEMRGDTADARKVPNLAERSSTAEERAFWSKPRFNIAALRSMAWESSVNVWERRRNEDKRYRGFHELLELAAVERREGRPIDLDALALIAARSLPQFDISTAEVLEGLRAYTENVSLEDWLDVLDYRNRVTGTGASA